MRAALARLVLFVLQSTHGIWYAAVCATAVFAILEYAVDRICIWAGLSAHAHLPLHALIVGLVAGVSVWLLLLGVIERRRKLEDEVRRIAELNLTVRNSLELIVLAHYADAEDHKAMVLECTARIDQKLKELFPVSRRTETGELTNKRQKPSRGQASAS